MISKMTKVLILSGCLIAAGTASANERNVIVPVIAGAAVGAVLATVISKSNHDRDRGPRYYQPRPHYQPRYQPVAYVPVGPRVEYRRFAPPPPRGHYDRHDYRDRGHDRRDNRW